MAEAVFCHLCAQIPEPVNVVVDSAGTDSYHELEPPDYRTMETLLKHGITGFDHAARKVVASDLQKFDYLLVMDLYNRTSLRRKRSAWKSKGAKVDRDNIHLFGAFDGESEEEVGDPYYGEHNGFEEVYEQCVRFSNGWIRRLLGWDVELDSKGNYVVAKVVDGAFGSSSVDIEP